MRRNQFITSTIGTIAFAATGTSVFGLTQKPEELDVLERNKKILAQFSKHENQFQRVCKCESVVIITDEPVEEYFYIYPSLLSMPDYDKFNRYGATVDIMQYEYFSDSSRIESHFRYEDVKYPSAFLRSEYQIKTGNTWQRDEETYHLFAIVDGTESNILS